MRAFGDYQLLGETLDDAAGECLDKGATLLGLGYPGGPAIQAAATGNPHYVEFPRGLAHTSRTATTDNGLDLRLCFSFSGLKTSLRYYLQGHPDALPDHLPDLAASYQEAVMGALARRSGARTGGGASPGPTGPSTPWGW